MRQLLAPIEQTAKLCKMIFLPPFVIHGTHSIKMEYVDDHRDALHQLLIDLRNERVDIDNTREGSYLNDYLTLAG